jgi:hypothetical protein
VRLAFATVTIAIDKGGGVGVALHHPAVPGHALIVVLVHENGNP